MGLNIKEWLMGKLASNGIKEVRDIQACDDASDAAIELYIRQLAFLSGVNLMANAIGKCEFKTFRYGKEIKERDYYLWNYEPNANENSSTFLHKLIATMYRDNEALVVTRSGKLLVADSYNVDEYAIKENVYSQVKVGDLTLTGEFLESDVMRFKLNETAMRPMISAMNSAYERLISSASSDYEWSSGHHMIAHLDSLPQGDMKWQETYQNIVSRFVRPYMTSKNAVIPEFNGYTYRDGTQETPGKTTRDIRAMIDDVFDLTSKCMGIPPVIMKGDVAGIDDAVDYLLTFGVDPICDMLQEEITRKRYGYSGFSSGQYVQINTTAIRHFDWLSSAVNVEKLISSGSKSINDVLDLAGETRIDEPWADEHFITKNWASISELSTLEGGEKSGK